MKQLNVLVTSGGRSDVGKDVVSTLYVAPYLKAQGLEVRVISVEGINKTIGADKVINPKTKGAIENLLVDLDARASSVVVNLGGDQNFADFLKVAQTQGLHDVFDLVILVTAPGTKESGYEKPLKDLVELGVDLEKVRLVVNKLSPDQFDEVRQEGLEAFMGREAPELLQMLESVGAKLVSKPIPQAGVIETIVRVASHSSSLAVKTLEEVKSNLKTPADGTTEVSERRAQGKAASMVLLHTSSVMPEAFEDVL